MTFDLTGLPPTLEEVKHFNSNYDNNPKAYEQLVDQLLEPGKTGPCADSSVFVFETSSKPEGILHLERHGGVLVSCDSLQNLLGPDDYFNEAGEAMMRAGGFFHPAGIGPGWRKSCNPDASDFARLTELNFQHLFSGHGTPRLGDAHRAYRKTFSDLYGF